MKARFFKRNGEDYVGISGGNLGRDEVVRKVQDEHRARFKDAWKKYQDSQRKPPKADDKKVEAKSDTKKDEPKQAAPTTAKKGGGK